ncbi:MAG: very short patch repair endonuclease [Segniliparus sp.]|uniref:very short patch repair endonuclease n=1 Tax=Segniliparus sp. TaxID=2804064 RepID=UPI003F336864
MARRGTSDETVPENSWATSAATRKSMLGNRSRDTSPELKLRKLLWAQGLRYRVAAKPLADRRRTVDIVFGPAKVAVEIHGCFWHGCPEHYRPPGSNVEYWSAKVARNRARDAAKLAALEADGWEVVVAWEHEQAEDVALRVAEAVARRRPKRS